MGSSPAGTGDELPLALQTEDKEYDDLEEKFQCVASSVATLKENVASYLGHLEVKPCPGVGPIQASGAVPWDCGMLSSPVAVGDVQGFAAQLKCAVCQGVAQRPRIAQVQGSLNQS